MLGGFGGLIGKPTPTASMTVSSSGVGSASEVYSLTFTSVSTNVSLSDVILRVTIGSNTYSSTPLAGSASSYAPTLILTGATPTSSATIGVAGSGSYLTYDTTITLTITPSSGTVTPALSTIALIYTTSGGNIAGPDSL